MASLLPLFPLNIVAFPNEELNLHIFETRYKKLVGYCVDEKICFGIPVIVNGLQKIGTEIEITRIVKTYSNGELDIQTKAKRVFSLEDYLPASDPNDFDQGLVTFLSDDLSEDQTDRTKVLDIFNQLIHLVSPNQLNLKDNPILSYRIAHHIAMNLEQEYELLEMRTEQERQAFILSHLQKILPLLLELDNLKERIKQNGHFKSLSADDPND